ncbi:hypothetical protein ACFX2I_014758 [Malus domestica]
MEKIQFAVFMAAAIGCFLMGSVTAFTHIVGGKEGWSVPENKTFYEDWAFPRTFGVGDRLVFPYRPGSGNVVVINKDDFDKCTQKNVIYMYYYGPTILTLTAPGDHYYYSGVGKHCEFGQKLHIKVVNKPGSSGKISPFKLVSKVKETTAGAPAPVTDAPAHAPSSATTIQNVGMASGLLTVFFSLLM